MMSEVYLRARGGTPFQRNRDLRISGLSPRTRRNRIISCRQYSCRRSISAHAEEPRRCDDGRSADKVYLRARGGTENDVGHDAPALGLSPRTRRNRDAILGRYITLGSISAHAEEPLAYNTLILIDNLKEHNVSEINFSEAAVLHRHR
ncbi:Hypothetical protein GbCGDNIH2_1629 [Granulibacter bethesdensis]|nr:Hypothetical protein GbCGDNIH2_1629 [Granulibacter bethesdensis]